MSYTKPFRYDEYSEVRSPIRLYRTEGGKPVDPMKVRYNFEIIESSLNHLRNHNFRDYACISPSKLEATVLTQDKITTQLRTDLTNVTYNRIPRINRDGYLPFPVATTAKPNVGWINNGGTSWLFANIEKGKFIFGANTANRIDLDSTGWHTVNGVDDADAAFGYAIVFDVDSSLWLFYKDTTIIGIVDGNGQVNNFITVNPTTTYEAEEAYIDLTSTSIEFWCKTVEDTVIKRTGYIDTTGRHDG